MMNLSYVCKRLVMILVAVLAVALLLGCASTGGSPDCGECEAGCESYSGEEKADCLERCAQDCG